MLDLLPQNMIPWHFRKQKKWEFMSPYPTGIGHKRILTFLGSRMPWWEAVSLKHNLGLWFLLNSSQLLISRSVFPNKTFFQSSACSSDFKRHRFHYFFTTFEDYITQSLEWVRVFCFLDKLSFVVGDSAMTLAILCSLWRHGWAGQILKD